MTNQDRATARAEALETVVARLARRHYRRYLDFKSALTRAQRHEMATWARDISRADAENPSFGAP